MKLEDVPAIEYGIQIGPRECVPEPYRGSIPKAEEDKMNDVAIDKEAFLSLWKVDELPVCDEGMELAHRFVLRAGEAVDKLDRTDVIATRNALIRAHKKLTGHGFEVTDKFGDILGSFKNWDQVADMLEHSV